MKKSSDPEHVVENRRYWDAWADEWVASGERAWAAPDPYWGCWGRPESELHMLPEDMHGLRAIELGCGTGYVSGWMVRRGAEVTAIDNSARQLATAKRLAELHGAILDLQHGNAENVPVPDASFDFAISEYGAAIWCDPRRWIPEAHRILRPGGLLVFLGNSPLAMLCTPESGASVERSLHRNYFELHRLDWTRAEVDPGGIEFNLPISAWLRLFRETGFEVLDYVEVRVPEGSPDRYNTPGDWASRWPAEQVWKLKKPESTSRA